MNVQISDDVFALLMRVATGEQLDEEETALVREFLDRTVKA